VPVIIDIERFLRARERSAPEVESSPGGTRDGRRWAGKHITCLSWRSNKARTVRGAVSNLTRCPWNMLDIYNDIKKKLIYHILVISE